MENETTPRGMPPWSGDERAMLEGWLDWYRATLESKVGGLDEEQVRTAPVPPSNLTPMGLVRHLAEVERNWFRRILPEAGASGSDGVAPLYGPPGADADFALPAADSGYVMADALSEWRAEVAAGRRNLARYALDDEVGLQGAGPLDGTPTSVRWILIHLVEEYARHTGHADLVRERIDGSTGV